MPSAASFLAGTDQPKQAVEEHVHAVIETFAQVLGNLAVGMRVQRLPSS